MSLRPFVDVRVYSMLNEMLPDADGSEKQVCLDRATKQELLRLLGDECQYDRRKLPLLVALGNYAATVKQVIMGDAEKPVFPVL